jgi:antitoxin (DNA-binding transcriptional repressor) of toxin-antitoxin stability system
VAGSGRAGAVRGVAVRIELLETNASADDRSLRTGAGGPQVAKCGRAAAQQAIDPIDVLPAMSDHQNMSEISAAEASKRFADMLDAVEHRGETFNVVRRGRAIATVAPAYRATLGELREFLTANPPDPEWEHDLKDLRRFVGPAPTTDPQSD